MIALASYDNIILSNAVLITLLHYGDLALSNLTTQRTRNVTSNHIKVVLGTNFFLAAMVTTFLYRASQYQPLLLYIQFVLALAVILYIGYDYIISTHRTGKDVNVMLIQLSDAIGWCCLICLVIYTQIGM